MDKFKQYLQEHSSKLDVEEPGPRVWKNIRDNHIAAKPVFSMFAFLRYAAAACILALAGVGIWHLAANQTKEVVAIVKQNIDTLRGIQELKTEKDSLVSPLNRGSADAEENLKMKTLDGYDKLKSTNSDNHQSGSERKHQSLGIGELRYIENSFMQVINIEKQKINNCPLYAESPAYFNDFKNRMMQMDNDEKLLRNDIKIKGPDNDMIDQLINIYQQKLNLLKQLQTEMNKMNSRYKQNKPASDSLTTYFLNI